MSLSDDQPSLYALADHEVRDASGRVRWYIAPDGCASADDGGGVSGEQGVVSDGSARDSSC